MDTSFQCSVNMGGRHHIFERPGSDIKKTGCLVKLKTMKKKFFLLRSTSSSGPARLEYYDSEKKFRSGNLPKRSIHLHTCFNINKKTDSRTGRFGIVLYTVHDSFTILTECEVEQEAWLDVMLEYQNEYLPEGDLGKEHYEHVWQVTMQPRGLGQGKGLKGHYRMCLNSTTISLFKVNANQAQFSIQLVTVRAVGHNDNSFWLELGNYASTGPGQFWFLVEDAAVAKNMHTTIIQYMASVKDYFDKDQQFAFSKKIIHSGFLDGFGGSHPHYGDSRKSHSGFGSHPSDSSLDFPKDYSMKQSDGLTDMSHPLCSSDFDGELSCGFDNSLLDHPSMHGHHGLISSHPVGSKHAYNFSELLYPTHLPTVKEGGSGEGFLLSDLPSSETSSTDFLRPEPATCLLSDDPADLPPRTYSLGSRPTKKFQGFIEAGARKVAGNEISRATSAPHIPKGRRERERKMDSPTPAPSPLSMSLKSDDSEYMPEYGPMRPRTASDSFNYRPRTSSFGKPQQNCRPRSSSYGQGKRPTINISKLKLERAMHSGNVSQRTSRESSLQSSFESLRVSSESLRRPSLELRQPWGKYSSEQNDQRNTPSPQMKNLQSDFDSYNDPGSGIQKTAHLIRTESSTSGRPPDIMARRSDHHHHHSHLTHDHSRPGTATTGGGGCEDVYVNIDFGAQPTSNNDNKPLPAASRSQHPRVEANNDNKPFPAAPRSQPPRVEANRYMNVDMNTRNRRSHEGRSLSVENVDTYFISELPFTANKPRTGSVGSKDKQMLRPESARKSKVVSVPSSIPSDFVSHQSLPLASLSSHSFGGSDSMRRSPCLPPSEKHAFRQKSGSTGSRPSTMRTSLGMTSVKEHCLPGAVSVPMRKSSLPRFSDDEIAGEYIEFPFPDSPSDATSGCHGSCDMAETGNIRPDIAKSGTIQSGQESSITEPDTTQSGTSHFRPLSTQSNHSDPAAPARGVASVNSDPATTASTSSSPSKLTSQPTTSSSQEVASYVPYKPAFPPPPLQDPSHLPGHVQKFHQTAEPASITSQTNSTDYVDFQPRTAQSTKPQHVDLERAESKLSSASCAVPCSVHEAVSRRDSDSYVEYNPGSVSGDVSQHRTPDSACSYVPTPTDSRTAGLAKLKQHQTSFSIPTGARKPACQNAAPHTDLFFGHGSNASGSSWNVDPEPLLLPSSTQTYRPHFQPIKTQSLDKIDNAQHRHLSSSADINGLPPTGSGSKHHHPNRRDHFSSESYPDCIETFSKESTPSSDLSCCPASAANKCHQVCANHMSDIALEAGSVPSSVSFDSLTRDSTPSLLTSMKPTVISGHARLPRHSLGDIMSITDTKGRVSENRSPTSTCRISVLDDLHINMRPLIHHSLTDNDFLEVTSKVTSHD